MNDQYNLQAMAMATRYNQEIFKRIELWSRGAADVLDFGAGSGEFANRFTRSITCVEPNADLAAQINIRHAKHEDIVKINKQFDLIYSVNVLEHIEDDRSMLALLVTKLKKRGKLLIFVPARPEIYSAMDKRVGHYRRYSKTGLVEMVNDAGCRIDKAYYFDSLGYLASGFLKLAGKVGWQGGLSASSVGLYDKFVFPVSRLVDDAFAQAFFGKNIMIEASRWRH